MPRVNISMSDDLVKWYKVEADKVGIALAPMLSMSLKQYADERENMKKIDLFPDMMKELKRFKNEIDETVINVRKSNKSKGEAVAGHES